MGLQKHVFSVFDVTRQVFFESALSLGIVNLKPLRPGHILIISKRNVPRLSDLSGPEVADLFQSVQRVGSVIESAYRAEALNVSLQDGAAAGQSVPHVHVHVIPRLRSDFGGDTDRVYPLLEKSESELEDDLVARSQSSGNASPSAGNAAVNGDNTPRGAGSFAPRQPEGWQVPPDDERKPRSMDEMEKEARWLRNLLEKAGVTQYRLPN